MGVSLFRRGSEEHTDLASRHLRAIRRRQALPGCPALLQIDIECAGGHNVHERLFIKNEMCSSPTRAPVCALTKADGGRTRRESDRLRVNYAN